MAFEDLSNSGAIPTLERVIQFASQRQRVIAHNIANLNTPGFVAMDASIPGFQAQLREAIEARRLSSGGEFGPLNPADSGEVQFHSTGLSITPLTPVGGVLFHDRGSRSLERQMQALAENTATFRVATELLRSRFEALRSAIAQRV